MTSTQNSYTTERLGVNNIADLELLSKAVYGRGQVAGLFKKKYDTVYTGAQYIGFIAYNNQHRPIAFYGVIPTLLWYNGRSMLAAQSADTMTHPDYRKLGLFTELANQTYVLCKEAGINLVFGFPNQNSLPGFINKLGWHSTETMDRFTIPVKKAVHLEKIAAKFSFLQPAYHHYQQRILKKYLQPGRGIISSVLADRFNGVFRDDNYLKYKGYSPTHVIKIDKAIFWIKLQNGLHIGDMENVADNFEAVMSKLAALAAKLGMTEIHFQTSLQTSLHKLFAKHYVPMPSYTIGFKTLEGDLAVSTIKFTFADIDIF